MNINIYETSARAKSSVHALYFHAYVSMARAQEQRRIKLRLRSKTDISRQPSHAVRLHRLKVRNLEKLVREDTWNEKKLVYDVENETIEIARSYAKFYLDRYSKRKGRHWTESQWRNNYVGLLCQGIFHIILQQLTVPCDVNSPVIDWRGKKEYDYYIPNLGSIEVKGFDYWTKKVLIKTSEWHNNDYCVVFRLVDKTPGQVQMAGYLTRKQVESLSISRKGEYYTPYADAYMTDFEKLNPSNQLIKVLLASQNGQKPKSMSYYVDKNCVKKGSAHWRRHDCQSVNCQGGNLDEHSERLHVRKAYLSEKL